MSQGVKISEQVRRRILEFMAEPVPRRLTVAEFARDVQLNWRTIYRVHAGEKRPPATADSAVAV